MDYFIPLASASPSFRSTTLLLPQPSLGSLSQLAVDLLVHTLRLRLVGSLSQQDFIPSVGGLDSAEGDEPTEGVCDGVQVFQNDTASITVILPRSPVIRARKQHHLASMRAFIEAGQFSDVLLLAATDAGTRGDESLRSDTPLRQYILTPNTTTKLTTRLSSTVSPYAPHLDSSSTTVPRIPHGGNTRALLEALSTPAVPSNIAIAALLIYTAEGDNIDSAYFFAEAIVAALELDVPRVAGEGKDGAGLIAWREPRSRELGLSGSRLTRERGGELFG